LIPHAIAMRHAGRFEGADVSVLPGVGHVPAEEVPDEVVDLICRTITLVREGRGSEARGQR
jgi:pimeloyl-ACP methyl ester carboxylesterase